MASLVQAAIARILPAPGGYGADTGIQSTTDSQEWQVIRVYRTVEESTTVDIKLVGIETQGALTVAQALETTGHAVLRIGKARIDIYSLREAPVAAVGNFRVYITYPDGQREEMIATSPLEMRVIIGGFLGTFGQWSAVSGEQP